MEKQELDLEKYSFDFEALDACPLCGGTVMIPGGRIRWLENDFWYVLCPGCGLKYMNPRPTMESYRVFYKEYFWQQKVRNIGFIQPGQMWNGKRYKWDNDERWDPEFGRKNISEKTKTLRTEMITNALKEHIALNADTKILEVGTSFPVTLTHLKDEYKCQVFAIEPSDEAREVIGKDPGINLIGRFAEELEEVSKGDRKYDAVIFSHVLENTLDPAFIIQCAQKSLKDTGVVYVQTPHLLTYDQENPYHPFIFSMNTLKLIAEKAGLRYQQVSGTIDKMLAAVLVNKK